MTLPLETAAVEDQYARRALDQVAQHFPVHAADLAADVLLLGSTGTQRKVVFGSATLTWTAAVTSAVATVTHGLGTTPVSVVLGMQAAAGRADLFAVIINASITSTQFQLQGVVGNQAVAFTGSAPCYWVAIG